jgi:hypothetical protein
VFQLITSADSIEIRQRLTEHHLALAEASYSRFVMDALAAGDDQKVADLTRSYVAQQRRHLQNNAWGLTPEEVTGGLSKSAAASVTALDDLAVVSKDDMATAAEILAEQLPAMGVSAELIAQKVTPVLQPILPTPITPKPPEAVNDVATN